MQTIYFFSHRKYKKEVIKNIKRPKGLTMLNSTKPYIPFVITGIPKNPFRRVSFFGLPGFALL